MRKTKNRDEILKLLKENDGAMSAQEIYSHLSHMDLATIYRNLKIFVAEGEVKELRINKIESIYEVNNDKHDHAICKKCGEIKHIKISKEELMKSISLPDFIIEDVEINLIGHCK